MKTILFIEDRPQIYQNLARLLNRRFDFFKLLSAASLMEAIDIISKIKIDIILMGTRFSESELDILDSRLKGNNGTKLIVPAAKQSPVANLLRTLEYKIQFDMPVDASLLLEMLLKEFEMDYGGQIHGISLSSFLQMIELEGATCRIGVVAGKASGYLFFDSGELVDAQIDELKGKDAALSILSMDDPLISVDYGAARTSTRKIRKPLMSLLIEAARIYDEKFADSMEKRRYKRFECSLSTLFDSRNVAYKGTIRNISIDGIYIASDNTFFAGQDICVTLFSQSLRKGCRIGGMVVRNRRGGIGIQFSELSMNQKRIVRLVMEEIQCAQQRDLQDGATAAQMTG